MEYRDNINNRAAHDEENAIREFFEKCPMYFAVHDRELVWIDTDFCKG